MYSTLDKNKACFFDLSKAYDAVSHELSLEVLKNIDIRWKAYGLFKSYLTNKPHWSIVNGSISETLTHFRVPQGTVLGPKLSKIYINDIFSVETKAEISYADDTALFYQNCKWEQIKEMVENDFNIYIKYFFDYKLITINTYKT